MKTIGTVTLELKVRIDADYDWSAVSLLTFFLPSWTDVVYKKDWYSYSIHASTAEEMESIKRKVAPMGYHVSDSSCVLFVRGQAAAIHSFLARIEEDDIPGYLYFLADRNAGGKDFKTATIHFRDVNGASDAVKYFCSSDRPSDGITFNFHELSRSLVG